MTNQSTELFHYLNTDYDLIAYTGDDLPTNHILGIPTTNAFSSKLQRGYRMTYEIFDDQLAVKTLRIVGKTDKSLNGIKPVYEDYFSCYHNTHHIVKFTGHILFGNNGAISLYQTASLEKSLEFFGLPVIFELSICQGKINSITDWSQEKLSRSNQYPDDGLTQLWNS